jgi:hypothetical protein
MLGEIVSYLDHGDRLAMRSACSRFESLLSNWNGFLNLISFRLPEDLTEKGEVLSTLGNSTLIWKSLKVDCLTPKVLSSNDLSAHGPIHSSVKELKLGLQDRQNYSSRSWSILQEFLTRFQHLEKLTLDGLWIKLIPHEGWSQSAKQVTKFVELRQCLKELRIKTQLMEPFELSTLAFCLERFTGEWNYALLST